MSQYFEVRRQRVRERTTLKSQLTYRLQYTLQLSEKHRTFVMLHPTEMAFPYHWQTQIPFTFMAEWVQLSPSHTSVKHND